MFVRPLIYNIILIFQAAALSSQQTSLISQAARDPYFVNAAYAGLEGTLVSSAHYRNQWIKLDGHPKTILIASHFPIYKIKSGFGFCIGQDQIGLHTEFFIKPSLNHVWKVNDWLLSGGLQLDLKSLSFNADNARTPDGEYSNGQIDHRDPELSNVDLNSGFIDLGASIFIQRANYKLGFSADRLLESRSTKQGLPYKNSREFRVLGLSDFEWANIKVRSGIMLYTNLNRFQTDFFSNFEHNGNIFGGLHVRGYNGNSMESLGITAGFALTRKLQLAYTHEFYLGKIDKGQVTGSQEMGLYYNLGRAVGLGKAPRIIHSPRYSD